MTEQTKPKRGRPKGSGSLFTQELADTICQRLKEGMTLREICRMDDIPVSSDTVLAWKDEMESFSSRYARAREDGYFAQFEEMVAIAKSCPPNNGDVQKAKLIVDTLKWQLSKALPKIYGDRLNMEHTGADGGPIKSEQIDSRDLARSVLDVLAEAGTPADLASVASMVDGKGATKH